MGAPAARVAELSRHWVRSGHDVTVLTGFPNHPTGRVAADYRKQFLRLIMKENVDEINVVRTWLLPFPNRKPYERILNYISFSISAAITGLFLSRPDVVIATSPQLLVGMSGWLLARFKQVPFVFEVRDLWPESLTAVGMGNANSLLHRTLAKIAGFLYYKSDRIVVVTPAFKDYLVMRLGVPAKKIAVVLNGVETNLFNSEHSSSVVKAELHLEDKFVVSYIGTMGMAHGLEGVLNTAAELQQSHPQIVFLFIGEGADKKRIVALARSRNLTNVRFLGEQPRETIPAYICASDICLVLLKQSEIFKTVIPTKMLEFMACCRPVVVGVDGQARTIVEAAEAGLFVWPENAADLTKAIVQLTSDPKLRAAMGRNGRTYILKHFSRAQTASTYLEILESLLKKEHISGSLAA